MVRAQIGLFLCAGDKEALNSQELFDFRETAEGCSSGLWLWAGRLMAGDNSILQCCHWLHLPGSFVMGFEVESKCGMMAAKRGELNHPEDKGPPMPHLHTGLAGRQNLRQTGLFTFFMPFTLVLWSLRL